MENYTERDWQRLVGWGMCPKERLIESPTDGAEIGFDRAKSNRVDSTSATTLKEENK